MDRERWNETRLKLGLPGRRAAATVDEPPHSGEVSVRQSLGLVPQSLPVVDECGGSHAIGHWAPCPYQGWGWW